MKILILILLLFVIGSQSYPGYTNYYYYDNYGSYYPQYQYPQYQYYSRPVYYPANYIYPGYGGWINPLGTGSGWAAGGGLVGNALSFLVG